ncbi:hypothetical protein CGRA01v4_10335 [Colletotrichum graminicola]|nr:hypothetical protein CGRA01v4_10335 [Colletotrichum graminicola]
MAVSSAAKGLSLRRRSHPDAQVRTRGNVCILYLIITQPQENSGRRRQSKRRQ